jgi:DNA-binding transcriptional LysR family regulator
MHSIGALDLRLLALFEALAAHRSVSRAADALDLPQPVVSQGLRRLRTLFDDVLFVRTAGGMAPTARATALRAPIAAMLAIARADILAEPRFEPAQSAREFRIVSTDFGAVSLLPHVMAALRASAPDVRLRMLPMDRDVFERLASTDADLAVGIMGAAPANIHTRTVFRDRYACVMRRDHPSLRPALSLAAFRRAQHVVVTSRLDSTGAGEAIDAELRTSHIALHVPTYASLPALLVQTDLIAIVPRTASRIFFAGHAVAFVDLPFEAPEITVVEAWHERSDADLGLRWLRDLVADAVAGSEAASAGAPKVYT